MTMPVIKSAKKKLRQDKKRTDANKVAKDLLKKVIKAFRKSPSEKNLQTVYTVVDKAVKKHVVHKNKAARVKSTLAKSMKKEPTQPHAGKKAVKAKKVVKKTPVKKQK